MYISRFKHLKKYTHLFSRSYVGISNCFQASKCIMGNSIYGKDFAVRHYFASKKQNSPIQERKIQELKKTVEDNEFLWKLNIVFNLVGVAAGFYFPKEALMFILTSNSIIQVYESSKPINKIVQLSQKSGSFTDQETSGAIDEIKQNLRKILITNGFLLASAIFTGLGILYPSFGEYSLVWLNFWILYNLKLNNFSHGFYLVLVSLLLFQYFFFTKTFQSTQKKQLSESI